MAELKSHPQLKLFSLNSNRPLAEAISKAVGVPLSDATVDKFSDDEICLLYTSPSPRDTR